MTRHLCATASPMLLSVAIPLRAANRPHAGPDTHGTVVWTDDDLEKLHAFGLIPERNTSLHHGNISPRFALQIKNQLFFWPE